MLKWQFGLGAHAGQGGDLNFRSDMLFVFVTIVDSIAFCSPVKITSHKLSSTEKS